MIPTSDFRIAIALEMILAVTMAYEEIAVMGRVVERIGTWILAGCLLYFAYRLSRMRSLQPQSAELKARDFALKLLRVSPGVFFAVLGTAILIFNLRQPLTISASRENVAPDHKSTESVNIRYFGDGGVHPIVNACVAINSLRSFVIGLPDGTDSQKAVDGVRQISAVLEGLREPLVLALVPRASLEDYRTRRNEFVTQPDSLTASEQKLFEQLDRAFYSTK